MSIYRQIYIKLTRQLMTLMSPIETIIFISLNFLQILAGLYNPGDGHIDPYSLTQALAVGARRSGAKIQQQTPVEAMTQMGNGEWEVKIPQGTIRARRVVNATGKLFIIKNIDEINYLYIMCQT